MTGFGGYTVRDNRGAEHKESTERCRVCGSDVVHSQIYGHATMACVEFLRTELNKLSAVIREHEEAENK